MSESRLEWKVGLFVLLALGLAAALIMKFSKSTSLLTHTYELRMITSNVGGIRPGATVLMAGVQVGTVRSIQLDESGKVVTVHTEIQSRFHIHEDARFTIEQAGFLGDQYVAITPGANAGLELQDRQTVKLQEPFNMQEVARSAAGLLRRVDETAARLNTAVGRIDQTILAEGTLTNLSAAVVNFRTLSERALSTLHGVDNLVQTNSSPLSDAITNLVTFSGQLEQLASELQLTIATNRVELTTALQNVQAGTARLNDLLGDLQEGKGLAGSLLKDEELRRQFASTISNLNVVSSNLSQHGLLWKPRVRHVNTNIPAYTGKLPFR